MTYTATHTTPRCVIHGVRMRVAIVTQASDLIVVLQYNVLSGLAAKAKRESAARWTAVGAVRRTTGERIPLPSCFSPSEALLQAADEALANEAVVLPSA